MDEHAAALIEQARAGEGLARDDVILLLRFDEASEEAVATVEAARAVGFEAAQGRGFIFGQIGVDALPCPENCRFCSFAACSSGASFRDAVVPVDEVVAHARVLADAHVGLISLMATAALPLERYLGIVRAVREAIDDTVPLMANIGDVGVTEARSLADEGVRCAYHALRLGEGRLTDIEPDARHRTFEGLRAAGLALMSGVEPLWEDAPADELADLIMLQRQLRPFATGACPLTLSAGCALESGEVPATSARVRQVAAITRLACGTSVPIGGVGGVAWVDAGTDPRNRGYGSSPEHLRAQVARKRAALEEAGWTMGGPLPLP